MVYSLLYRRPSHVNSAASRVYDERRKSVDGDTLASEGSAYTPFGIPDALSFDNIVSGGTCPVSPTIPNFLSAFPQRNSEDRLLGALGIEITADCEDSPARRETS